MAYTPRLVAVLLAAALAAGCTRVPKKAEPTPSPAPRVTTSTAQTVTPAPSVAESESSSSASATESPEPSPSSLPPSESVPASELPTESPSASSASPEPAPSAVDAEVPTEPAPAGPPGDVAAARTLLVAGSDLGTDWVATAIALEESTHEQGDLCGIGAAGESGRLLEVATDLTSDSSNAAGRHQLTRYKPGAAAAAAKAMIGRLNNCTKARQDFDGQLADVSVTPTGVNTFTFSLTFGPDAVTYGALAISVSGDHVSTAGSYAADVDTAAALATRLDVAARKKLAAAS